MQLTNTFILHDCNWLFLILQSIERPVLHDCNYLF